MIQCKIDKDNIFTLNLFEDMDLGDLEVIYMLHIKTTDEKL